MVSNLNIQRLKTNFTGQSLYVAKNIAYNFSLFDDVWQLNLKGGFIYLEWMHEAGYDEKTFIAIRKLLAEHATCKSPSTIKNFVKGLKALGNSLRLPEFQMKWLSLTEPLKSYLRNLFAFAKREGLHFFDDLADFTSTFTRTDTAYNNILDGEKGSYSSVEYDSIKEQIRLATDAILDGGSLMEFRGCIGAHLLSALMRRPCQLIQLKWADILPVGKRFAKHRSSESVPEIEHNFSDMDCLHVRTFKGKDGRFRFNAEKISHRLEPDLTKLILIYRELFKENLLQSLNKQKIILNKKDVNEIMLRCPILPGIELFRVQFLTKKNLFDSLGAASDTFHLGSKILHQSIKRFQNKYCSFQSDRIDNEKLSLANNRLRHTVLTTGARMGLSSSYLAQITGVTRATVEYYIDLDLESRVQINEAFAAKEVLLRFGVTSIQSLQKKEGFTVINEFEEEIGIQSKPDNCSSCASKLGAPMACYPCGNFIANEDANHVIYLDKALSKYRKNKSMGNKHQTLHKLEKIIIYIRATIKVIAERKLAKNGVSYDAH